MKVHRLRAVAPLTLAAWTVLAASSVRAADTAAAPGATPTTQTKTSPSAASTSSAPAKTNLRKKVHSGHSPYAPDRFAGRAGLNYRLIWGIDSISVRLVESGELVRFTYRVLDPAKSQILNDKQSEAKMDDPKAGVSLVVPTMEKVGQLRQTTVPEAGHSYWVTFSNKGRRVKSGDRVDVAIGQFKAANVVVD